MPLYEYECKSCDHVVEVLVRSPNEQVECPECGNEKIEQILSVPSAPSVKNRANLPMANPVESCQAPRCCGGGCQM